MLKYCEMFKLIIFDLDGVLVNSNNAHIKACRTAVKKAGIKRYITKKEITSHFGESYRVVMKAVMHEEYTPEKLEIAYKNHSELIRSGWFLKNIRKIPGLRKFLIGLKNRGIRLAIASGNERSLIDRILEDIGVNDLFDLIISAENVQRSKPNPEMIEKAVKLFNSTALLSKLRGKASDNYRLDDTLFVGDAKNDILAAKSAGVISAVVLTGVLNKRDAKELNPDFIFRKVTDMWLSPLGSRIRTKGSDWAQ